MRFLAGVFVGAVLCTLPGCYPVAHRLGYFFVLGLRALAGVVVP